MKIKFYSGLIYLMLIFVYGNANAQSPDWLWAKSIGGVGYEVSTSIAIDASGNIYTVGYFNDTVDFDPGPGIYNLTSTSFSIFISKVDNAGSFIWAKSIGGTSLAYGFSIAIDNAGNVYTTGFFHGTCDFDPDPSLTFNLITLHEASFISKLDSAGNFVWAKSTNGFDDQRGYSIALDDSANVFITGYFSGATDFDPDTGTYNVTSSGFLDMYISKLDSSGRLVWNRTFGGISGDEGHCIMVDHYGNVFIKGLFSDTIDFDPGPGTCNLFPVFQTADFICKLDNDGNFKMAASLGWSTSSYRDRSLAVDDSGNMYLTGGFYATSDFDMDSIGVFNLNSAGGYDIFLAKYDSLAHLIWVKGMGGTSDDFGGSIALGGSGNIYFTGIFIGNADMDPDTGVFILQSGGYRDNFISEFDNTGNFLWAKEIGGTNSNLGCALVLDSKPNIYLTGSYFLSPFSIGPFTFTNPDTTLNSCNLFIAKLDTTLINGTFKVGNTSNKISIYPNPAADNFMIDLGNNHSKVKMIISDFAGKIIYSATTEEPTIEINTTNFSSGIYLVQIKSDNFIETKKLIIQK